MVSSWFSRSGSGGGTNPAVTEKSSSSSSSSLKEVLLPCLHPQASSAPGYCGGGAGTTSAGGGGIGDVGQRFSPLLLEHGEKHLQDWAVVAFSSPCSKTEAEEDESGKLMAGIGRGNKPDGASGGNGIQWSSSGSPEKRRSSSGSKSSSSRHHHQHHNHHRLRSSATRTVLDKESYPTSVGMTRIEGRLHLCSRSVVFEPSDSRRGIVRCPFQKMVDVPHAIPRAGEDDDYNASSYGAMCIELTSKRHLVIKENNVLGPFQNVHMAVRFQFTFLHSSPTSFIDLCVKLFEMSESKRRPSQFQPELNQLLKPMLDRPFAQQNLVDLVREQVLVSSLKCWWITPLQEQPGVAAVTNERFYVQPAAGVLLDSGSSSSSGRAVSWSLSDLVATARRYHGLRDSAVELYFRRHQGVESFSILLAFERRHDRETVLRELANQRENDDDNEAGSLTCFTDREFVVRAHAAWQRGELTNCEYLLALNSAAGRSFHDLSRYPVFPWVLADYESSKLDLNNPKSFRDLSKPVGALNPERLEYFTMRMAGLQDASAHDPDGNTDEAFLYGTHYSAPGYVLYFLVRSMPEHMLCLQNGKFDAPDRMFHSLQKCYDCVLTNHADVKELLPEFYFTRIDFLINCKGLPLGATQQGDRVDDVQLPPWARSPRDFLKKHRAALESDYVNRHIQQWVDLIFGCKSRGDAAREASNLFHPAAYLGPTDLAALKTEQERFQAELQATEFGIVPDQLFVGPHPQKKNDPKLSAVADDFVSSDIGRASSLKDETGNNRETWELLSSPAPGSAHGANPALASVTVTDGAGDRPRTPPQQQPPAPSSQFNNTKVSSWSSNNGAVEAALHESPSSSLPLRGTGESTSFGNDARSTSFGGDDNINYTLSRTPLSQSTSPKVQSFSDSPQQRSEWDMKFLERTQVHSDSVSGCVLLLNEGSDSKPSILATTSLDGGLKVHRVFLGGKSSLASEENERKGFPSTLSRFSYSTIMSRAGVTSHGAGAGASSSKLTEYRSHSSRDPLASLVLASDGTDGHVAFAGGHDDVVLAYGINSACAVASVYSHRDAVTGLDLLERTPFDSESALWLENSTHIMISGSWDATVKVWSASVSSGETVSIHRDPLAELFDADSSIVCVSACLLPSTGGVVIAAGCADGSFCVWNVHSDGVQVVIHNEPARRGSGPCSVVKWVSSGGGQLQLFAAFSTGMVASYSLVDGSLHRVSAVSIGVAVLSLVYAEGFLLIGSADGSLRLVPVSDGGFFEKPTLWLSVNSKSSPGISSIGVTRSSNTNPVTPTRDGASSSPSTTTRFVCCTGGEDGSLALFELRKIVHA